jgi:cell division septal protein FtsQ
MMDDRPIVAEPGQRYWRRKANRRVRKARLTQRLRRWSAVAFALAIITVALFQAGVHAVYRIRDTPGLAVERIEIEGALHAGPEAIRSRLAGFIGTSIVDLNLHEVAAAAKGDPWVLDASARRVLPGTLRVHVAERRPCAVASIDGRTYIVDETGFIVAPGRFEGLPLLTGLDRLDRDVLVALLSRGVRAVERLRRADPAWLGEIAELRLGREDRIEVLLGPSQPTILLDPKKVERNVGAYLELRREIEQRTGSLASVDLRWRDRISVIPRASREDS